MLKSHVCLAPFGVALPLAPFYMRSEAIRVNPECSASVRVGLGLCCYKLGQISRAQAAMARALELDPQNVQALVGSAILELSTASARSTDAARRTENAISTISMAYHIDEKDAMVLNHLANHYFWTWSLLKVTIRIEQGSRIGKITGDLQGDLMPGDLIRIGSGFATAVGVRGVEGDALDLRDDYTETSGGGLKLYRKDYHKVRKRNQLRLFSYTPKYSLSPLMYCTVVAHQNTEMERCIAIRRFSSLGG